MKLSSDPEAADIEKRVRRVVSKHPAGCHVEMIIKILPKWSSKVRILAEAENLVPKQSSDVRI